MRSTVVSQCFLAVAIAVAVFFLPAIHAHAAQDKKIDIGIQVDGHEVTVDVNCFVSATPQEAWSVMTDYGHATQFISNLERSTVLSRTNEIVLVSQKGTMGWGPFSVTLESVTEIRLTPFEKMQSRMISGNMKKYNGLTRLIPEGTGTRIVYHVVSVPDVWIPPLIGRVLVEHETRERFQQLLDEILRRKALSEGTH